MALLLHQPCSVFNQSINISIIFSVAREPDLQEWTARTRVYDILHEPVSHKDNPRCKLIFTFLFHLTVLLLGIAG